MIKAIRDASHGRRQLSPELLDGVLVEIGDLAREKTAREFALTEEEAEILLRTSQGASNRAIAAGMDISEVAVKKRLAAIYQKLGASDRASAVAVAIRRGLIGSHEPVSATIVSLMRTHSRDSSVFNAWI